MPVKDSNSYHQHQGQAAGKGCSGSSGDPPDKKQVEDSDSYHQHQGQAAGKGSTYPIGNSPYKKQVEDSGSYEEEKNEQRKSIQGGERGNGGKQDDVGKGVAERGEGNEGGGGVKREGRKGGHGRGRKINASHNKCKLIGMRLFMMPLVRLVMMLLVLSSGVDASVVISPSHNYATFEKNTSNFTFNCSGNGNFLVWTVDGYSTGTSYVLNRGIQATPFIVWTVNGYSTGTSYVLNRGIQPTPFIVSPDGLTVSSQLIVLTTKANNNITVICTVQDSLFNHQSSNPVKLTLQGILPPPQQFKVNISNSTVNLSWIAPNFLQLSTPPTILDNVISYNLTNSTRTFNHPTTYYSVAFCNYSLDLRDPFLENTTILDYHGTMEFTLFAVNGAGNGNPATFVLQRDPTDLTSHPNQTIPTAGNIPHASNTTTTLLIVIIAIYVVIAVMMFLLAKIEEIGENVELSKLKKISVTRKAEHSNGERQEKGPIKFHENQHMKEVIQKYLQAGDERANSKNREGPWEGKTRTGEGIKQQYTSRDEEQEKGQRKITQGGEIGNGGKEDDGGKGIGERGEGNKGRGGVKVEERKGGKGREWEEHKIRDKSHNKSKLIGMRRLFMMPLVRLVMMLLVLSSGVDASVVISPSHDYTTFENNASTFTFNSSGKGIFLVWKVDGYTTGESYVLNKGIRATSFIVSQDGVNVSSQLIVPTTKANNNITVICTVQDLSFNPLSSNPVKLILQGILPPPQQFIMSITNRTVNLFWIAPDSLQVATFPTISYYVLSNSLTNSTKTFNNPTTCIPMASCNYSLDLRDPFFTLLGSYGGENTTILDYNGPVKFAFFVVNGAGNGIPATFVLQRNPTDLTSHPNQTIPTAGNTPHASNNITTLLIVITAMYVVIAVMVVLLAVVLVVCLKKKVCTKGWTSRDIEKAVSTTDGLFKECSSRAIGGNTSCTPMQQCTAL